MLFAVLGTGGSGECLLGTGQNHLVGEPVRTYVGRNWPFLPSERAEPETVSASLSKLLA